MQLDNRVIAVLLIVGIFASMTTIALYTSLTAPELPTGPTAYKTTGFLTLEVATAEPADENGGISSGETN